MVYFTFIPLCVTSECCRLSWRSTCPPVTTRRIRSTWVSFHASWIQRVFPGEVLLVSRCSLAIVFQFCYPKLSCDVCFVLNRFEEDELFSNYDSRDVLVLRNGHYYTFPVIDTDGKCCLFCVVCMPRYTCVWSSMHKLSIVASVGVFIHV